ncbi:MAG: hypothetical protein AB1772_04775 [Candidatus Zixiibacteriota bacterium]
MINKLPDISNRKLTVAGNVTQEAVGEYRYPAAKNVVDEQGDITDAHIGVIVHIASGDREYGPIGVNAAIAGFGYWYRPGIVNGRTCQYAVYRVSGGVAYCWHPGISGQHEGSHT